CAFHCTSGGNTSSRFLPVPPTSFAASIFARLIAGRRVAYIQTHITIDQRASVATGPRIAFVSVMAASSTQCRDHGEYRQRKQTQCGKRKEHEAHRNAVHGHLPYAVKDAQ